MSLPMTVFLPLASALFTASCIICFTFLFNSSLKSADTLYVPTISLIFVLTITHSFMLSPLFILLSVVYKFIYLTRLFRLSSVWNQFETLSSLVQLSHFRNAAYSGKSISENTFLNNGSSY